LVNVAEKENIQIFRCKVETLDGYVSCTNSKVDFIKCDVEGAELFVFRGGISTLKEQQPIVFTEMLRKWSAKFNYHPNDIIEFFRPLGYAAYTIYPSPIQFNSKGIKLREFNFVDENTIETNYFFLHREKHASIINRLVEPS
jgi:hypothetical protein